MVSDVVQFREEADALQYLRTRGINPNEFGKEAFESALRRVRAEEKARELAKIQAKLSRPIEDVIREDREER